MIILKRKLKCWVSFLEAVSSWHLLHRQDAANTYCLPCTSGSPKVLQVMLFLKNKSTYSNEMFRDFQSILRCCPHRIAVASAISGGVVILQKGYDMKLWIHRSWKLVTTSFQQSQFSKWKTVQSHLVLSQVCRVGGAGHVTFLPPDTELWPLLCGEHHCHGVPMFLWFPRLVAAPDRRNNFWQYWSCVVAAGHCCLLWQNVDHQRSRIVETCN